MKSLLKKGNSSKVVFDVHIHTLAPWQAGAGPLAVAWKRGATKRGNAGPPVQPSPHAGGAYAAYSFDASFTVPATLFKVRVVGGG
jgi:hypothetical protein